MSIGVNQVFLVGCLGHDPKTRVTSKGTKLSELSLATTEVTLDITSGSLKKRPEWHRVVAFGPDADFAEKYLKKGSKLAVVGRLKTQKYDDKAGVSRWITKVIAEKISFLDSNGDDVLDDSDAPSTDDASH